MGKSDNPYDVRAIAREKAKQLRGIAVQADAILQEIESGEKIGTETISSPDKLQTLICAMREYAENNRQKAVSIEDALKAGSEDGNLTSHNETCILEGCVSLMNFMVGAFREWLDAVSDSNGTINLNELDETEQFRTEISGTEIVERLFLWNTFHSGHTSSSAKARLLNAKDKYIFAFEPEDE